ncbi:MTAP family purine nucleoside phosphorylase [Kyrpidia tusciae]|uniref:Purine or other phosphorylase family 1 n=1 Tax=Kyrpidia tusciae (strain DSM 2912 / NBRC 15312 / T2) TaxID=562970 RepID=D5WTD0_KYRT2|nr:MTAP family purine nucleoside phosphorylase [Kyrpidia tusciae]ADG07166.1 purine or other phosphorylase family 1 [Kyrpidia tusciae DSM 2912]
MSEIDSAEFAIIGGSSTFSLHFPEDVETEDVQVLKSGVRFDTPYGPGPEMKLFTFGDKRVWTVKMHGWRPEEGLPRGRASQQLFWILGQAGVRKVYAEGGVGACNHLLDVRDVVIPDDYIDQSMRKDVGLGGPYLLVMRQPTCPHGRRRLARAARDAGLGRVFERGVYANTDGRHFESVAEVRALQMMGADVIGQSMCPEVYLAREIGACYARVDLVVNYAEGVVRDWRHEELRDLFFQEARAVGRILLDALRETPLDEDCGCRDLRKDTLLTKENIGKGR